MYIYIYMYMAILCRCQESAAWHCNPLTLSGLWGYNPMSDDRSEFTQSGPVYGRARCSPLLGSLKT